MSFLSLIKIMIQRWTVVLPVLFLTALGGIALIVSAETTFSRAGTELLVSAQDDDDSAGTAGRITPDAAGQIVSSAIDQPSFRRQFEERGLLGDYDVSGAVSTTVISVSITGNDQELVLSTAEALIDGASGALAGVVGAESAKDVRVFAVAEPTLDDVVSTATQQSLSITLAVLESGAAVVNPFPPNQPTVRALLDLALRPAVKTAVEDVAPDVEYLVEAIPRDTAPILSFSVASSNVDQLEPAYVALISALGDELVELQSGANVRSDLTVFQTLVPPTEISRSSASIVRSAVALALLGIAAAAALAVGVDGAIISRTIAAGEPLVSLRESDAKSGPSAASEQPVRSPGSRSKGSGSDSVAQKGRVRSKDVPPTPAVVKSQASGQRVGSAGSRSKVSGSDSVAQQGRVRSKDAAPAPAVVNSQASEQRVGSAGSRSEVSGSASAAQRSNSKGSESDSVAQKGRVRSKDVPPTPAVVKSQASEQRVGAAGSRSKVSGSASAAQRSKPKGSAPEPAAQKGRVGSKDVPPTSAAVKSQASEQPVLSAGSRSKVSGSASAAQRSKPKVSAPEPAAQKGRARSKSAAPEPAVAKSQVSEQQLDFAGSESKESGSDSVAQRSKPKKSASDSVKSQAGSKARTPKSDSVAQKGRVRSKDAPPTPAPAESQVET